VTGVSRKQQGTEGERRGGGPRGCFVSVRIRSDDLYSRSPWTKGSPHRSLLESITRFHAVDGRRATAELACRWPWRLRSCIPSDPRLAPSIPAWPSASPTFQAMGLGEMSSGSSGPPNAIGRSRRPTSRSPDASLRRRPDFPMIRRVLKGSRPGREARGSLVPTRQLALPEHVGRAVRPRSVRWPDHLRGGLPREAEASSPPIR
jgi:hypothetical protein